MRIQRGALAALMIGWAACASRAEVKLAPVFSDHMVLQREMKLPVWGSADPGETVTVTAGSDKGSAKADSDGKWSVTLEPLKASDQGMDVTVAGSSTVTLHDVLVGDVWVASGQSNMEFGFTNAHNATEVRAETNRPTIRLLLVKKDCEFEPKDQVGGVWQACDEKTVAGFSAVAYFFGVEIQADQHVPIGLIGTYWGGQTAQAFTSLEGLKAEPTLADLVATFEKDKTNLSADIEQYKTTRLPQWEKADAKWKEEDAQWKTQVAAAKAANQPVPPEPPVLKRAPGRPTSPDQDPHVPTVLFNGMINPLIPLAIKGAIWYQGESNAGNPVQYQTLFPAMITDWRKDWGEGDFPFLWVQLANFQPRENQPTQSSVGWAGLREAQSMTLKLPNTGQAVIIDIGQGDNIHPKDKLDVGKRLALAARHVAYGEDLVYSGPTYGSLKVDGNKAIVTFKNVGSGLTIAAAPTTQMSVPPAEPASSLKGFSIAGEDQHFYWADATIDGDTVIVTSEKVPNPVAVRYAWANNPEANLYNKEHLPASPFRTDTWTAGPAVGKR
jgi:sialate O-acetylesterase